MLLFFNLLRKIKNIWLLEKNASFIGRKYSHYSRLLKILFLLCI